MFLAPTLALLLSSPLHAQSPAPNPVQAGADIAAFHAVAESTMSAGDSLAAWVDFVAHFPRSPLAEIALATCLEQGGDISSLLARLTPTDRAFLVASYRDHHDTLVANPPEGPVLTDADPETSRSARRRARRP
ncbi:MAG: hypothetical protein ABIO70_02600 [Pseudomonadota bacterium]